MGSDDVPIATLNPRAWWIAFAAALLFHALAGGSLALWLAAHRTPPSAAGANALTVSLAAFEDGPTEKKAERTEPPEEPEPKSQPKNPKLKKKPVLAPAPVARAAPPETQPVVSAEVPGKVEAPLPAATASETAGSGGFAKSGAARTGAATQTVEADYLAVVGDWLARHKKYPLAARRRHIEGAGILRFAIRRDGHVLSYGLDKGTGSRILDAEIERMIARAAPLPPMPPELEGARREFTILVRFKLEGLE
ncbi:MAG: TonB family protein [Parvibaculum sp.]|nr:TonB family protein [Parvibaculum sp.]